KGLQRDYQVASTAKHFIAYSNNKGAREGMARVDPQMSPREIENIHVYPWVKVIKEGGLLGVMSSYNDYDGFPIQSSYYWLTTRLRKEMKFKGYVVSDSDAVEYLHSKHGTSKDMKESVRQAVEAGLNVRCTFRSPDSYVLPLRELVEEGSISMETINERVRDILRVKFMVGLFDMPYQMDLRQADVEVNSIKNQEIALQASRESIVLLKNENNTLPLSVNDMKKISVCGPNANDAAYALTHYGPLAVEVTSVLQGIEDKVGKSNVLYTKGCDIVDANWPESEIMSYPLTEEEKVEIEKAVQNAKKSDVAIVVLGGNNRTCGENKSRSSLDLPGRQLDLLQAVYNTGTPVVLVLIHGRPNSINWADKYIPAILEAWYPGSQGGTAIADVLFGDYNPGGKLTVTVPKSVGQIPFNFPSKPNSQVDGGSQVGLKGNMSRVNGALYPFGYGLSYTTFDYSDLEVFPKVATGKQNITIRFKIKNTGNSAGDEVVQLYTRDVLSSVTTYEKNLRGFERIHLDPREEKELEFVLTPNDLSLLNKHNEWIVEPGEFRIMVGSSSEDIRLEATFHIRDIFDYMFETVINVTSDSVLYKVLDNNEETKRKGKSG
ncbi:MAG: beta-glucosidase, partial [Bacteroidales bacterium]|nr:beta-glucosidase [Bacteroidales bacterium]